MIKERAGRIIIVCTIFSLVSSWETSKPDMFPSGDNTNSIHKWQRNSLYHEGTRQLNRFLDDFETNEANDFNELNDLLGGLSIEIPDVGVYREMRRPINGITADLTNIICSVSSIGNINVGYETVDNKSLDFTFDVSGVGVSCAMNWQYEYDDSILQAGGARGKSGTAAVSANDNSIMITLTLRSSLGFQNSPPTESEIKDCELIFNIDSITLEGGIISSLTALYEDLITSTISSVLGNKMCDVISGMTSDIDEALVKLFLNFIEWGKYDEGDPLAAETYSAVLQDDVLFDYTLNYTEQPWSNFTFLFDKLNKGLGSKSEGEPDMIEPGQDLRINDLVRESGLLEENGSFKLDLSSIEIPGIDQFGVLYEDQVMSTNLTISVIEVRVVGLDTFRNISLFMPISEHTLMTDFKLGMIDLEVDLSIMMGKEKFNPLLASGGQIEWHTEEITVKVGLKDIDFKLGILAAINTARAGEITLGSMLNTKQILPCLVSTAEDIAIAQLYLSVKDVTLPTVEGFISPGVDNVINIALSGLFVMFGDSSKNIIPGLFDTTIRQYLNTMIQEYLSDQSNIECVTPKVQDGFDYVNMHDLLLSPSDASLYGGRGTSPYGDITRLVKSWLDDALLSNDPNTGEAKVNDLIIRPLTEMLSGIPGTLIFEDSVVNTTSEISIRRFTAKVRVALWDTVIKGLDSLAQPLEMIEPQPKSIYTTDYKMTIGANSNPIKISSRMLIGLKSDDFDVLNNMQLGLEIDAVPILASFMAMIREESLLKLPLKYILNYNCWVGMIDAPDLNSQGIRVEPDSKVTAGLEGFSIDAKKVKISATCLECTSPGMIDLHNILETDAAIDDATSTGNTVLNGIEKLLSGPGFVQGQLDRVLNEAKMKCPLYSPDFFIQDVEVEYEALNSLEMDDQRLKYATTVFLLVGSSALVVFLMFKVHALIVKQSHLAWLKSLPYDHVFKIHMDQVQDKNESVSVSNSTHSMYQSSKEIPHFARVMIPFVIVVNTALFLSGHLNLGASVLVYLELAGQKINIPGFLQFSVAKGTMDMWREGSHEMAIIILVLSVIWPYAKQLLTMALWFVSTGRYSLQQRGRALFLLDAFGKWSFYDIFTSIISAIAFRVTVNSPQDLAFLPPRFYHVELITIPVWGIYANMIAQLISQINSHFITHYHRKIEEKARSHKHVVGDILEVESIPFDSSGTDTVVSFTIDSIDNKSGKDIIKRNQLVHDPAKATNHSVNDDNLCVALHSYRFALNWGEKGQILHARPATNTLAAIIGGLAFLFITCGCIVPCIQIETVGIIGLMIESGQGGAPAKQKFSILGIFGSLWTQAVFLDNTMDYIGHIFLIGIFTFTMVFVPLLLASVLLFMWFAPLDSFRRHQLHTFIDILSAWQYLEVFLLALVVMNWQIRELSVWLLNKYCVMSEPLVAMFSTMAHNDILSVPNAQCLLFVSNLEPGAFLLVIGSMMLAVLHHFVLHAVVQQKKSCERSKYSNRRDSIDINCVKRGKDRSSKNDLIKAIHIRRPQFTDIYRNFLVYEVSMK